MAKAAGAPFLCVGVRLDEADAAALKTIMAGMPGFPSRSEAIRHALRVVAKVPSLPDDDAEAIAQAEWATTRERLFAETDKIKRRLQRGAAT